MQQRLDALPEVLRRICARSKNPARVASGLFSLAKYVSKWRGRRHAVRQKFGFIKTLLTQRQQSHNLDELATYFIKEISFFRQFTYDVVKELAWRCQLKWVGASTAVFKQGDTDVSWFYVVLAGRVSSFYNPRIDSGSGPNSRFRSTVKKNLLTGGVPKMLAKTVGRKVDEVVQGDAFGFEDVIEGRSVRDKSCFAMGDCDLLAFSKQDYLDVLLPMLQSITFTPNYYLSRLKKNPKSRTDKDLSALFEHGRRYFKLFRKITDAQARFLWKSFTLSVFEDDRVIVSQGDWAERMFFIFSGTVDVYVGERQAFVINKDSGGKAYTVKKKVLHPRVNSVIVYSLTAGDMFGEPALFRRSRQRIASVVARGRVELLSLTVEDYLSCDFLHCGKEALQRPSLWPSVLAPDEDDEEEVSEERAARKTYKSLNLMGMLQTAKFFRLIPLKVCRLLAPHLKYAFKKDGDVAVKQGDLVADNPWMFITLNGSVSIHQSPGGSVRSGHGLSLEDIYGPQLGRLGAGFSFGEAALSGDEDIPRNASVVVREPSEFIAIHKTSYLMLQQYLPKIINQPGIAISLLLTPYDERTMEDLDRLMQCFRNLPFFEMLPAAQMKEVLSFVGYKKFRATSVLFKEGEKSDSFYVIMSGQVEAQYSFFVENERKMTLHNEPKHVEEVENKSQKKFAPTARARRSVIINDPGELVMKREIKHLDGAMTGAAPRPFSMVPDTMKAHNATATTAFSRLRLIPTSSPPTLVSSLAKKRNSKAIGRGTKAPSNGAEGSGGDGGGFRSRRARLASVRVGAVQNLLVEPGDNEESAIEPQPEDECPSEARTLAGGLAQKKPGRREVQTVHTLEAGDTIGELLVYPWWSEHSCSFVALDEVEVVEISVSKFAEHLDRLAKPFFELSHVHLPTLNKLPSRRTEADHVLVHHLVKDIPFCKTLPEKTLQQLVRKIWFECTPKEYVIFEQNAPGENFYIILKGSVGVYMTGAEMFTNAAPVDRSPAEIMMVQQFEKEFGKRVNTLQQGQGFGEVALLQKAKRGATIVTDEECHLLVIRSVDYDAFVAAERRKVMNESISFLKSVDVFSNWPTQDLMYLLNVIKVRTIKRGTVILKEGEKKLFGDDYSFRGMQSI